MQRDDVTPAQKKMLLSDATLTGIYMTGNGRSIMVTCEIINVHTYLSLSSTFLCRPCALPFHYSWSKIISVRKNFAGPSRKVFWVPETALTSSWKPHCCRLHLPTHRLFELSILWQEMLQKAIAEAAREVTTHVILIYKLMNHYQNVKGQAELVINYITFR